MIKYILIPTLVMLSCGSTKSNQSASGTDSLQITAPMQIDNNDSLGNGANSKAILPTCLKNKIDSFKLKEAHEQPQKVVEYKYKGKTVYFVVMPCCDFFNEVYDDKCKYLGAPDGGFTGKGDGLIPDFFTEAKEGNTIWKATTK